MDHSLRHVLCATLLSLLTVIGARAETAARPVEAAHTHDWEVQTRDPQTGQVTLRHEQVDPAKIGVIAVDIWNYHWCKTATMRVDAFVPRINRALEAARSLGMTVMICPSDVVDNYVGYPQRERALNLPRIPVPTIMQVTCPPVPDAGGCACGRERCGSNYGWDGMHPGLELGDDDWMPDTQAEVYAICQQRGLTHLIYVGFHTQVCLLGKPMGLRAMKGAGLQCLLARDMTDAHPGYDPSRSFTPDLNTAQVIEHFERHLAPTIDLRQELRKRGHWDDNVLVDPVRITPWGTDARPHLFEESVTITLTAPLQPQAEIRYSTDGSEPSCQSTLYHAPFTIVANTQVRAAAFHQGQQVCLESKASFARLGPLPPRPDRYLQELMPVRSVGFGHTYSGEVRYSGSTQSPQANTSNRGSVIKIGQHEYAHGIGVHAPCELVYELRPEFQRFVALAGIDEYLVSRSHGSNLARYPSVVFKIFLDGSEVAHSPVMRIQSPAWRFDVPIPPGSQRISLVAMDAHDGNREDFADWAEAGFVVVE